jgi:hypothetical protein
MSALPTSVARPSRLLLLAFLAHCVASLVHFTHNAIYLREYPNLPTWLTATGVYASWCALTAVGVTGLLLHRCGFRKTGLGVLAIYALLGCGGLDHYTLASLREHTLAMNLTIWLETLTASLVLFAVIRDLSRAPHQR